jgi:hypothetical protein
MFIFRGQKNGVSALGIVVERPGIRERPVEIEKVLESRIIASFNGLFRHIMPAHP